MMGGIRIKTYLAALFLSLVFIADGVAGPVDDMVAGAYGEIANKTAYNTEMLSRYFPPTYKGGEDTGAPVYPGGDVNPREGVCADLVVRALRRGGVDLQRAVHEDVVAHMGAYGVKTPDRYSDHRRVWILRTFFKRQWASLSTELKDPGDWQPGDIVIWHTGSKKHLHIGMAGNKKRRDGFPFVIHNMRYVPCVSAGVTLEEDVLEGLSVLGISVRKWQVIGHYRLK